MSIPLIDEFKAAIVAKIAREKEISRQEDHSAKILQEIRDAVSAAMASVEDAYTVIECQPRGCSSESLRIVSGTNAHMVLIRIDSKSGQLVVNDINLPPSVSFNAALELVLNQAIAALNRP